MPPAFGLDLIFLLLSCTVVRACVPKKQRCNPTCIGSPCPPSCCQILSGAHQPFRPLGPAAFCTTPRNPLSSKWTNVGAKISKEKAKD
jgi:hypothetical protein